MAHDSLMIVGASTAEHLPDLVRATLAHWPADDRPPVIQQTLAAILARPESLDHCGVAWLVIDHDGAEGLFDLICLLQDRQIPSMLTRRGENLCLGQTVQSGIIAAPENAPPECLCAAVRTMWNQIDALRDLQTELKVLRAQQGGLCGQIDKIDEELRLAAQLQREFLPAQLPTLGNLQFRALYRPAGYVSGDIYDVFRVDEKHVGFFVADAVGHGVPAALLTVYIKQALRIKEIDAHHPAHYRVIPPHESLSLLNTDMMKMQAGKVRTVTAWYGLINIQTLELNYARAGHPYPLLLRGDGSVQTLETEGGLLGVFPDEKYDAGSIQLLRGDRLLLYTDGFEVAFSPESERLQRRRLANTQYAEEFRDLAHGRLEDALARLAQKLDTQTGSLHQVDDLTVLCLGVEEPSAGAARVSPVTAMASAD